MKRVREYPHKRVTMPIDADIDAIRLFLKKDTGIDMTYVQIFNFLIHFYMKHAQEPRTRWASLKAVDAKQSPKTGTI